MDDNKIIAIILGIMIVFGFGGLMVHLTITDTVKEKTKQLELQWKIDSVKSVTNTKI